MVNLILNIIIFGILPIGFIKLILIRKHKKKVQAESYRVQNEREDWKHYKELYLDLEEDIIKIQKEIQNNCTFIMIKMLDTFYNHNSDIQRMLNNKNIGISRDLLLTTLMDNYEIKRYAGSKFPIKNKKKTVETVLKIADRENKLVLCILKDHCSILVQAKENNFIDIYGPSKEYKLNRNIDKIIVITSIKK
jgi:hypothetical protein